MPGRLNVAPSSRYRPNPTAVFAKRLFTVFTSLTVANDTANVTPKVERRAPLAEVSVAQYLPPTATCGHTAKDLRCPNPYWSAYGCR